MVKLNSNDPLRMHPLALHIGIIWGRPRDVILPSGIEELFDKVPT